MAGTKAKPAGRGRSIPRSQNKGELPQIVRIANRLGRRIPARELRALPKDLSDQIDHYVYGTQKR